MKLLISGASGFVGANLCKYLQQYPDAEIISLVRRKSGSGNEILWDELTLESLPTDLDAVIHLAGKAHDVKNVTLQQEYWDINYGLTKKLFDIFSVHPYATQFLFMSSVKAAADNVKGVLDETVQPNPATPYGKSKLAAEQYILSSELSANKSCYVLRPCIIHGEGNKGNLNLLYNVIKKGIPYPLGAFENKKSYLYIHNLSAVIWEILNQHIPSGVYNIADDEVISTNELIDVIGRSLNKKVSILKIPRRLIRVLSGIGDTLRLPLNTERLDKLTGDYVVSNEKIKNALQLNLPYCTRQGLEMTFKSFRS
ncbi:NAD-dependent epimerase/dehydratase family protein [Chitinophaga eiseniae]|uniref:NAD-dependent epimerase/dehydratase family protein n=1 Tax=Chitinophaga eiseniae TaxID=634771 RepID=A0A847SHV1_9BACT|nr:NAD-dependent epimerase/dehydratase family protein [Chitinophaga eiseniae]NLR78605.1 NAD-dependent epimerase/dehydratase family protein [Chitinophaga eiseniae]